MAKKGDENVTATVIMRSLFIKRRAENWFLRLELGLDLTVNPKISFQNYFLWFKNCVPQFFHQTVHQ